MANKIDKTVVRNAAYQSGEFNIRERHNERKNESYLNGDIDKSRANMNIHFRRNLFSDGTTETYEQTFNRLLAEEKIVKRGLKPDAKVFDELIFDVNTAYFENNGGYEYAKKFFAEAYNLAVKEIGDEDYVLSAVLHADKKNKVLSEKLGRNVYHYHLHVVYVPVVHKEILWSKRTKDKTLVGKVKELIPQISHSKKWPMRIRMEVDGKTVTRNSYSFLQDRFFEHMRMAGFKGFERGELGSTAEHLSDLEYKIKMESERLAKITAQVQKQERNLKVISSAIKEKQQDASSLDDSIGEKKKIAATLDITISEKKKYAATIDKETEAKKKDLGKLKKKIVTASHEFASAGKIDSLGEKRSLFGAIQLSEEDWKFVSDLAKEGVKAKSTQRDTITAYSREFEKLNEEVEFLNKKLSKYKDRDFGESMKYLQAKQRAPMRFEETVADIMRRPPEEQPLQQNHVKQKHKGEER